MNPLSTTWSINGETRILGVIGDPVAHSLSPAMHNLALEAAGLNWRYLPFHIKAEDLPQAVRGLAAAGVVGFNATIPHKEALVPLMHSLDETAQLIGAVNTVSMDESGRMTGYNTDGYGFIAALAENGVPAVAGMRVVVLGAGGASRAVLVALLQGGVKELVVANRTVSRAEAVLAPLKARFPGTTCRVVPLGMEDLPLAGCDLLVNTTSIGLYGVGAEDPFAMEHLVAALGDHAAVMDAVYAPGGTALIRAAKERGLKYADGLAMLIHQGARAYTHWTGRDMPIDRVRTHLRAMMEQA